MTVQSHTASISQSEYEALAARVDAAIAAVGALDPQARDVALAMRAAIEEFHKVGLTTIVRHLKADPRGKELLFDLVDAPEVYALCLMHGLVRPDLQARVRGAIALVRPYMQSHGGDVELVRVTTDTAYVRLVGACDGCSMSAVTLRQSLEEALRERVPEIRGVEVVPAAPLVPLSSLTAGRREGWITGPPLAEVAEGQPYRLDTERASVVIIRLGDQVWAFRNACAHQGLPLDEALIDQEASTLTCPWHGYCYDILTGECLTAPDAQLESYPARVDNGIVKVRPLA